jgi:hypothetical protein
VTAPPAGAALAVAGLAAALLATGCLSKPGFECELGHGILLSDAQIGTEGGLPSEPIECEASTIVGLGFTMRRDPGGASGDKTAISVGLRCATIANRDGEYATGAIEDGPSLSGGLTDVDGPFVVDCPSGQVVTGVSAHVAGTDGLFNSIAVACAPLEPSGVPGDGAVAHPVEGTGLAPAETVAACAPGESLRRVRVYSGSELDRLLLTCERPACE